MESHAANVATATAERAFPADTGLTDSDASARLARDGYNELPTAKPRRLFAIAADVAREPMFLLLIACGAIYLLLGDKGEAAMLLAFVFVIIGITFVQERKSERALEALRDLSSPRALVIRDGEQRRIAGRDVVVGDLLVLAEGDRVAADAMVCRATNLAVDESLLTGESVPVAKIAATEPAERMGAPGGERTPFVFSGSLVVQGKGMARVLATGNQTALGRIGSVLAAVRPEPTRIQRETAPLVKRLAWCGARIERAGRDRVRTDARRVAQCDPRRHHARDGDPARGAARRPYHFPWARRVAHRETSRADAARACARDAGLGHGAVRRQDRAR